MLRSKGRKSGKKNLYHLVLIFTLMGVMAGGCRRKSSNPNSQLDSQAFSSMRKPCFVVDKQQLMLYLQKYCEEVHGGDWLPERMARNLYRSHPRLFWVTWQGVTAQADSLLEVLQQSDEHAISIDKFHIDDIRKDVERLRTLRFDDSNNKVERVMARLEVKLTMAYLYYATIQRYGAVNPLWLFNRMDTLRYDTIHRRVTAYRTLYDVKVDRPSSSFFQHAMKRISQGEVTSFLNSITPQHPFYQRLREYLKQATGEERIKTMCNMERCRWRGAMLPDNQQQKYVVVNIAAFELYAYQPDSVITMRIGCGATKTKTPILVSHIKRMELNPMWNIPYTIIKDEVAKKAGDSAYFARNRYLVYDKQSGKECLPHHLSAAMLRSGNYRVAQEGGEGNSLGRIIFRFDNNFAVYLHDTSSPAFFQRKVRAVSHGCVRVQRPFDLAMFLRPDMDEWEKDKMRITMGLEPNTLRGKKMLERAQGKPLKLVSVRHVEPEVPVLITYFTLYPMPNGEIGSFPDIYGYDTAMEEIIKPFLPLAVKTND